MWGFEIILVMVLTWDELTAAVGVVLVLPRNEFTVVVFKRTGLVEQ